MENSEKSSLIATYVGLRLGENPDSEQRRDLEAELNDYPVEQLRIWVADAQSEARSEQLEQECGIRTYVVVAEGRRCAPCPETLLRTLRENLLPQVEPNWAELEVDFDDEGTLVRARVNGPKCGDVDLRDRFAGLVPNELFHAPERIVCVRLRNLRHRVELHVGRTVIGFENCESGYVSRVDEDGFEVTYFEHLDRDGDVRTVRYTRSRLLKEFEMDDEACQALDVSYEPRLDHEHRPTRPPAELLQQLVTETRLKRMLRTAERKAPRPEDLN
jgi:hypothetical protein